MAFPIDDRDGLALRFADFEMLPDLLRLVEMRPGEDPRPAWLREIADSDINTDHIEDDNEDEPEAIADDALRLAVGLELLADNRLTTAGFEIAFIGATPILERDEFHYEELRHALARQILNHYHAPDFQVAVFLQRAADRLSNQEHCPGLLFVELQVAVELSRRRDAGALNQWIRDAPENRRRALAERGGGDGVTGTEREALDALLGADEAGRMLAEARLCDAVTEHYLEVDAARMTLSEVGATGMLLTFTGLLDLCNPLGPVQYLVAPRHV